ncbi:MAG: methyl-accepting chemotaxis protein [Epulopiscium sp.]|nr:methyl-accepting chemotaxis protein [Candidatus Epulonipiscium sp.]
MKSTRGKLRIYFGSLFIIVSILISLFGYNMAAQAIKRVVLNAKLKSDLYVAKMRLEHDFGALFLKDGKLYDASGKEIEGKYQVVDTILEDLGDVATIFVKNGEDYYRVITNVLDHEGQRAVGTVLDKDSQAYAAINNGETYTGEADILGKPHLTIYEPILDNQGEIIGILFVGISMDRVADMIRTDLSSLGNGFLMINIIGIAAVIVLTVFIAHKITDPIVSISKYAQKVSDLNVQEDIPQDLLIRKDELGILAKAFQSVIDSLRKFISNVDNISQQLAGSSEELSAISTQASMSAEEISKAVEEIARKVGEQAKEVDQGEIQIEKMGRIIAKEWEEMKKLNSVAEEVDALKNEGVKIVETLVERNHETNKAVQDIYYLIIHTNEDAEKIENASKMIKNIADQTNLLALNAAIEAARAGEQGKGFAVVAEEIRKLAEQSDQFAGEIAKIIKELTDRTEQAVNRMEITSQIVSTQTQSVEITQRKFEGIAEAIGKMKSFTEALHRLSNKMAQRKDNMIGVIENLNAVSQENAAATEQITGPMEEQVASIEEVANASHALSKLAEEMSQSISSFKY